MVSLSKIIETLRKEIANLKQLISTAVRYKGSVNAYGNLPTSKQATGDMYNIVTADKTHNVKAGDNVCWNGSTWDVLSGIFDSSDLEKKISANTTSINTNKTSADKSIADLNTKVANNTAAINNYETSNDKAVSDLKTQVTTINNNLTTKIANNESKIDGYFSKSYAPNPGKSLRIDKTAKISCEDPIITVRAGGSAEDIKTLSSTTVSMQEIFSSWDRISCNENTGGDQNSSEDGQVVARGAYYYDDANNAIVGSRNSSEFAAFISGETYGTDWTLEYMMDQRIAPGKGGDNDGLFGIIAYMVDKNGKFHTISLCRMSGTAEHAGHGFVLAYDLYTAFMQNSGSCLLLQESKTAGATWYDNYTKIRITRTPTTIKCETADPNQDDYNSAYTFIWTLPTTKPDSWTQEQYDNIQYMMANRSKIGFGTESNISTFKVISQTGLFDEITVYNLSTSKKETYKNGAVIHSESIDNQLLPNTIVYSVLNDKAFYYRGNGSYIELLPRDKEEAKIVALQNQVAQLVNKLDNGWDAASSIKVKWANVVDHPTSMPANGGTADSAKTCTGNAATATKATTADTAVLATTATTANSIPTKDVGGNIWLTVDGDNWTLHFRSGQTVVDFDVKKAIKHYNEDDQQYDDQQYDDQQQDDQQQEQACCGDGSDGGL